MRVLLITNYFPPHHVGGAEVVVYNTCYGLLQRDVEAAVLMINARMPQTRDRHHEVQGVPVHEVTWEPYLLDSPLVQAFDPRVYRKVMGEIRRFQPDLVHVHNVSGASLAPFTACRRLKVPVLLTLHDLWLLCPNNMLYRRDGTLCDVAAHPAGCGQCFRRYDFWANIPWRRQVFAYLVQNVRLFLSPSWKLVAMHVAAGYDSARFRVVPNGIQPGRARPPAAYRLQESVRDRGLFHTLLFAGALVEIKGIQTVIEALPMLARHVERLRLLIAGTGEERYRAALLRHSPAVQLLGRVPFQEMRSLYASSDLTLMPSTCYENAPMVISESLMAGTPVLGSAMGGIPEMIEEGATGYLFPPGDPLCLAEGVIQHFARSARERRAMRQRCAKYALAHMTLDRYLDRLQQVYAEALGS